MVFELAAGDIRREMSFGEKEASWKAYVLHQVAVALAQLHKTNIAHQDLKPSNVLGFPELRKYKLSDLGRSSSKSIAAPSDGLAFPGDMSYAPPEYFYGYIPADYHDRRYGSDGYLLGSMISFLFVGLGAINFTFGNLAHGYKPDEWQGKYEDVLPFLISAHTAATAGLKPYLPQLFREEIAKIYFELCHPDPHLRGHPEARAQAGRPIGLDKYMSRFNLFALKLKIEEHVKNA
jgi:serine/threonine protein kinase